MWSLPGDSLKQMNNNKEKQIQAKSLNVPGSTVFDIKLASSGYWEYQHYLDILEWA